MPLFTRIGLISFMASSMPRKLYFAPPVSAFFVLAIPIRAMSRIAPSSAVWMFAKSAPSFDDACRGGRREANSRIALRFQSEHSEPFMSSLPDEFQNRIHQGPSSNHRNEV